MKQGNKLNMLIGLALVGGVYFYGKKQGRNECLYQCQEALVKTILEKEEKEQES